MLANNASQAYNNLLFLVKVLCVDNGADYQICFERIIGDEYKIRWLHKKPDDISKGKYVVLFKVNSRMPESLKYVLKNLKLNIEGKTKNLKKRKS